MTSFTPFRTPLWLLPLLGGLPLHAQTTDRATSVEVSHERNHLNNGSPDWKETGLRLSHSLGKYRQVDVGVVETRRFGLKDTQVSAGYTLPLAPQWVVGLEGNYSNTHRVLAKHGVGLTSQYEFAPAWLAHLGLKHTRYDATTVNQASVGLEHYFSSFSWLVSFSPVRASGTSAYSGSVRGNYYYGDRNSVGLIAAVGEEATPVGGNNVVIADIKSIALVGRHWVSPQWAVNYALGSTSQGSFYTRNGARLGAQYTF